LAAFSKIRWDRSGPRLEIGDFLIQILKNLKIQKNLEKYVKSRVNSKKSGENIFQISTVLYI
jgi:hypothetical protein